MSPENVNIGYNPANKWTSIAERRELVSNLVEAGVLLPEIVSITGVSDAAIRCDLRNLGVDISVVGMRNDRNERNRSTVLPLANAGMTLQEISIETGLSEDQIKLVAEKHQIEIARTPFKYQQHGNPQSYNRGCRCEHCKASNSQRATEYRDGLLDRSMPEASHGTNAGYVQWACRCERCKEAGVIYRKSHPYHQPSETRVRTIWTDEQDQAILDYSLTSKELAEKLGKTSGAVSARRTFLRQNGHEARNKTRKRG